MKKMIAISIVTLAIVAFEQSSAFACVDYPDWMTTSTNSHAAELPETPPPESGC
jgi:hypothetical protein